MKDFVSYCLVCAKRHSPECCPKQALIRHSLTLLRNWEGSAKGCIQLIKIYSVSSTLISETYHQGPLLYTLRTSSGQAESREATGSIYVITNCYLLGLAFTYYLKFHIQFSEIAVIQRSLLFGNGMHLQSAKSPSVYSF